MNSHKYLSHVFMQDSCVNSHKFLSHVVCTMQDGCVNSYKFLSHEWMQNISVNLCCVVTYTRPLVKCMFCYCSISILSHVYTRRMPVNSHKYLPSHVFMQDGCVNSHKFLSHVCMQDSCVNSDKFLSHEWMQNSCVNTQKFLSRRVWYLSILIPTLKIIIPTGEWC